VQAGLAEFERRGAQLVAVGQGSGQETAHYCGQIAKGFPCLGDPERAGYRELGLRRGSWWTTVLKPFVTEPRESFRLVRSADLAASQLEASDVLQMGGVAVVDTKGVLRALHVAETTADMPTNDEIFAALTRLESREKAERESRES
jgi:hypothetical protein